MSNVKQLSQGLLAYAADYDELLPPSAIWRKQPRIERTDYNEHQIEEKHIVDGSDFKCPLATAPWSYAMNGALSGFSFEKLADPSEIVLLFEADAYAASASGGSEWFVDRHAKKGMIGFADGHVRIASRESALRFEWRP